MADTYTWGETRDQAIHDFAGEMPNAETEEAILAIFRETPQHVIDTLTEVATAKKTGKARSGWAVTKKRLTTPRLLDVTVTDTGERLKQLRQAEAWIRNAGGYIDRESEIIEELFDEHLGNLRHWPDLQPTIIALWHEQRHRFIRSERQALARGLRYQRIRTAIGNATHTADINLDTHAELITASLPASDDNVWGP